MPLYQRIETEEVLSPTQVQEMLPDTAWDFRLAPPAEAMEVWGIKLYEPEEVPVEIPPTPFADLQAQFIQTIDREVDAVYAAVIGNRGPEYTDAANEAQAFKDAGYPEDAVPFSVASWATAKTAQGWTNTQAADDILAEAAKLTAVKQSIRQMRLKCKESARRAEAQPGLDNARSEWTIFITGLRAQLGI